MSVLISYLCANQSMYNLSGSDLCRSLALSGQIILGFDLRMSLPASATQQLARSSQNNAPQTAPVSLKSFVVGRWCYLPSFFHIYLPTLFMNDCITLRCMLYHHKQSTFSLSSRSSHQVVYPSPAWGLPAQRPSSLPSSPSNSFG